MLTDTCTKYLCIQNTAKVAYPTVQFLELHKFAKATNNFQIEQINLPHLL